MVAKLTDAGQGYELRGPCRIYTVVLQIIPDRLLVQYQNEMARDENEGLENFTIWLNRQVAIRLEMSELKESLVRRPTEKKDRASKIKDDNTKYRSRSRTCH
jgi:hypothetical protein